MEFRLCTLGYKGYKQLSFLIGPITTSMKIYTEALLNSSLISCKVSLSRTKYRNYI